MGEATRVFKKCTGRNREDVKSKINGEVVNGEGVKMDEIHAAVTSLSRRAARLDDPEAHEKKQLENPGAVTRELVLTWFAETQASLILQDGRFPSWFHGFISRQEAEDQIRDKTLGSFLIRLSEKSIGYILSYKGKDRCRHFVINPTKDNMLVVCGDCVTHTTLPALIEHFTHTAIQPFDERLTSDREAGADQLYDVIHGKSHVKPEISVQALRSLWDQRAALPPRGPPLPPKGSNRGLMSFINRSKVTQEVPPVLKKNVPQRTSSLSATLISRSPCHSTEPKYQSENWPCKMETDEDLPSRTSVWATGGSSFLDTNPISYSAYQHTDGHQSSQSMSLPDPEDKKSGCSRPAQSSPPASQHTPLTPPRSSSALFKKEDQPGPCDPLHMTPMALHPNPLYQISSGLCAEPNSYQVPGRYSEISSKLINDPVTPESTYQDVPEQQNTYEDIPAMHSNTYACLKEVQTRQNTWGKKTHKWWKFLPDSKK
ncbi:uncharacterized protein sh2d7 isoform X2 [Brachyhypopomus gauderio]|uniref:uncharacterized protein sh2d7 isoform X2 n=1 Tax=Brachyhypopomus gauderio TaxID=698409 RepID=UPI00404301C2